MKECQYPFRVKSKFYLFHTLDFTRSPSFIFHTLDACIERKFLWSHDLFRGVDILFVLWKSKFLSYYPWSMGFSFFCIFFSGREL